MLKSKYIFLLTFHFHMSASETEGIEQTFFPPRTAQLFNVKFQSPYTRRCMEAIYFIHYLFIYFIYVLT